MKALEHTDATWVHMPVLRQAVVLALEPCLRQRAVDGTVGLGGHAAALLEAGPSGLEILGVDKDPLAIDAASRRLEPYGARVHLVHGDFRDLDVLLSRVGWPERGAVDAVLFDLGVSSPQLDRPERGFSYRQDGPLDMRMDPTRGETAADLLMRLPEAQLANVLWQYGEERHARRIAHHLVSVRRHTPIRTTEGLRQAVIASLPPSGRGGADHPARRTFQALRIAVNDELGALRDGLGRAVAALRPGGRVAVISFHSLEDRLVKRAFRAGVDAGTLAILTPKPIGAPAAERRLNPRSRSAKLRVAERTRASLPPEGGE